MALYSAPLKQPRRCLEAVNSSNAVPMDGRALLAEPLDDDKLFDIDEAGSFAEKASRPLHALSDADADRRLRQEAEP